jgi:SAM-dependent methyltransferase
VEFYVADAIETPFADEYFDVIVSLGMFEYLKDPTHFLAEIRRILKPNGIVLFTCHNKKSLRRTLSRKMSFFQKVVRPSLKRVKRAFFPSRSINNNDSYYGSSLKVRSKLWTVVSHNLAEICDLLTRNDLKLVAYRTITFRIAEKTFNRAKKVKNKRLRRLLFSFSISLNRFLGTIVLTKNYGGNLIIKARKRDE